MAVPGAYSLCSVTITTAVTTPQAQTAITGLEGMTRAVFDAELSGSGGSTAVALVQSRISSGGTWREVASIDFAAAGAKSSTVIAAAAAPAAFATLSANSVLNWLGTELRVMVSSSGTWTSGNLTVRVHVS